MDILSRIKEVAVAVNVAIIIGVLKNIKILNEKNIKLENQYYNMNESIIKFENTMNKKIEALETSGEKFKNDYVTIRELEYIKNEQNKKIDLVDKKLDKIIDLLIKKT